MTKIYYVRWNYDDARFTYYNKMNVTNLEEWEKRVIEKAIRNKNKLMEEFLEDGGFEEYTSFEEWVQWCIDETSYYTESEIDNYKD